MGLGEGTFHETHDPLAVVESGVLREEASSCWGDVGMTEVCEDVDGCGGVIVVLDYTYGKFIGRAFEAEGDRHLAQVSWKERNRER